ncbi:MAG: tyrosine--tRNA ligase [Planctomycetes bacterium GWA2_40_7]|nr:MAG: tyrosine--tRNA ligase [Planctomycetes bacterium GWA2_40_7]OHB48877.1 MAG: tyrosine--tRNA ligase [Planctomycetes bacterium GWF2_40_8]OHB87610.1 MAG: tyrosine--tRNA ligase [Planctomycetes bacterium RIFCSPHIGHO2_02_FULL_40_12]OHC01680.1 MAG: tyrosine--tRNA ligase [Planctomycetes bacterium RIFCSPLOWO2_12_FULL_40_19]
MFKGIDEQLNIIKRGVVEIIREDELIERLYRSIKTKTPLRAKLGLDPTAPDIHIGNAIPIHKLRNFQELGHTAVLIIGDYTAIVGDPSGVNKTRPQLSHEDILKNTRTYLDQIGKILDIDKTEIRYNSEWFKEMKFTDVITLASKMTVARMMERDDFSKRYTSKVPISLHEFIYPLMQGYDSIMVRSDVEIGGTDQIFSLLVGRDLQRDKNIEPQVALTTPLLEGIDGNKKMSKSLDNYIGIYEDPKEIFGKTMRIGDDLMRKYFELATDMTVEEIDSALKGHPRQAKIVLGKAIVRRYYNEETAREVAEEFDRVFKEHKLPDNIPQVKLPSDECQNHKIWIVRLLVLSGFAATNGEARRLISQGGVSINNNVLTDPACEVEMETDMILRVGKRRFARIVMN